MVRCKQFKLVKLSCHNTDAINKCDQVISANHTTHTMTSIDDLFKKPFLPSTNGSTKRKFEDQDAEAAYKSAKLDPTVDDAPEDEDEDMEAGPELPPEEDEDEEGRFFGSGTNQHTNAALFSKSAGLGAVFLSTALMQFLIPEVILLRCSSTSGRGRGVLWRVL